VAGAEADDEISEIDMSVAPFNQWEEITTVLRYKNDFRGVNFIKRDDYLILNAGAGSSDSVHVRDYGCFPSQNRSSRWVSFLKYPYYIQGIKKYTVVDPDAAAPLETVIEIPDIVKSQMLIQTAYLMYSGMYYRLQNENSSSIRFSKMSEVQKIIMSLSYALKDGRWNEAPGRGHAPDHRTRFINTNDSNA